MNPLARAVLAAVETWHRASHTAAEAGATEATPELRAAAFALCDATDAWREANYPIEDPK